MNLIFNLLTTSGSRSHGRDKCLLPPICLIYGGNRQKYFIFVPYFKTANIKRAKTVQCSQTITSSSSNEEHQKNSGNSNHMPDYTGRPGFFTGKSLVTAGL